MNPSRFRQPSDGGSSPSSRARPLGLEPRLGARPWRSPYHPPRKTVLVVDDEPCLLDLLGDVLRKALKARVFAATDSIDALRLIFQSPPDLIISDIVRPGLDGIEFTRRVRRFSREVPVLIISGGGLPAGADDARAAGASACMAKPPSLRPFLRLVRRLLVRRARLGSRSACLKITPTLSGRFQPRPPKDPP